MRSNKALWLSLAMAGLLALAPTLADARAGSGSSQGSRGAKTYSAPPSTQTAPQAAKPMERSATPQQQAQRPGTAAQPAAAGGGFFQRNPFLGGLMGGIVGAGLVGMLMGGGFGGAGLGMGGMLGGLLQVALIGGLIYLAVMLWRRRSQQPAGGDQPAYAYGNAQPGYDAPMQRSGIPQVAPLDLNTSRVGGSLPPAGGTSDEVGIGEAEYKAFEQLLVDVQAGWSKGDIGKLRQVATPEMVGYFSETLSTNASRGIENHIADVRLEQGDLSEAWREDGIDYATVAMRFSMLDYGKRMSDGQVVEGSDRDRVEATELWTFMRSRGGRWILSAIQQTN